MEKNINIDRLGEKATVLEIILPLVINEWNGRVK